MRVCLFAGIVALLIAGTAFAQNDRRDRQNPELIVESGGRLGSCDSLQFTEDGQYVMAVGDDKVVRIWPYRDGKLQVDGMQVLRWSIWREHRGAIFALALSPDKENKHVAIAGLGPLTSAVAVLERATGKVLHQTYAKPTDGEQADAIWSLAYAPDGKRVAFGDSFGGVWIWDFTNDARLVARHGHKRDKTNKIRLVHFYDEETLLSVAEDGSIRRVDLLPQGVNVKALDPFETNNKTIFRVTISRDKKWFAAGIEGNFVLLRSLDGKTKHQISLQEREFPRAVAFDRDSERLAVSIGRTSSESPFYMETEDRIVFYDLNGKPTAPEGPRGLYRAWFIAFHPNKKDVAIAAGENHEVTLWRLADMREPVSVMSGAGKALWDVALSTDGSQIAFRDQRNPKALDPNARAQGPWRAFDLLRREWTDPDKFEGVKQLRQWNGWTVEPHPTDANTWYAVTPERKRLPLPLDKDTDGMPLCYTFLPPLGNGPPRLAVGHLWGFSVFELTDQPKRIRLCTGHQADVTALAASKDGSFIVAASRDQTISAWNLKDWENQPTLGASFALKDDRLMVEKVAAGSPAWETGLVAGDEVKTFKFAGAAGALDGGPQAWLARLQNPEPGTEHFFVIRRAGQEIPLKTTVRQRPLWRFFPTKDNEWVLWMWQNSYYDTSTKGDSYIGWHVNAPDMNREPTFYRAEQFRRIYERPDVIDKLLQTNNVQAALREALGDNPLPPRFNDKEPPFAGLKLAAKTTKNDDVTATLTATPHGDNPDFQPVRVELWINDFRFLEDKQPDKWDKTGKTFRKVVTLPNAKLRAGKNIVTFQVHNRTGGRAEITAELNCTRPAAPPRLFGLAVGVNDYSAITTGPGERGKLVNLTSASNDAAMMQLRWLEQKALYTNREMFLNVDKKAKLADILRELDGLAEKVGPEDRCVIFLAGHGLFVEHKGTKEQAPRTTWLFCCPDFDATRPEQTGVTSEVLYTKLAAIAGRKLVILDACHSGEAAANPVRSLVPSGQGPVIIASCDRNQSSYEDPKKKHGVFTYAMLEALGKEFAAADFDKNQELDPHELYLYTRRRMPKLLQEAGVKEFAQVPILFAPDEYFSGSEKYFAVAKVKE
jgi:WD40 repeat protein